MSDPTDAGATQALSDEEVDLVFAELRQRDEDGPAWPEANPRLVAHVVDRLERRRDAPASSTRVPAENRPPRRSAWWRNASVKLIVVLAVIVGGVWIMPDAGRTPDDVRWRSNTDRRSSANLALRVYALREGGPVALHERPGTRVAPDDEIAVQYRSEAADLPYLLIFAEGEDGRRVPLLPADPAGLALTAVTDGVRHSMSIARRPRAFGLSGVVRLTAAFLPIRVSLSQLRFLREDGYELRSVEVRLP